MKRWLFAFLILLAAAPLARAHFIWLVPETDGASAQVLFSDNLQPDDAKLLEKIAGTNWFARLPSGKTEPLQWKEVKGGYRLTAPTARSQLLGGVCEYGVIQRGNAEPFLLTYSTTVVLGAPPRNEFVYQVWDELPLQIVLSSGDGRECVVYRCASGKTTTLADAEYVIHVPGQEKPVEGKSSKQGVIELPKGSGLFGIRVRLVEKKDGKHGDKQYKEARHYATLVFEAGAKKGPEADGAATKLLAEARAARATWRDFPGFTADVGVNFDGKTAKGKAHVTAKGEVTIEGLAEQFEPWTRRELSSLVQHRLPGSSDRETPCAFTDKIEDHPLGRAVRVLNDELHSGYRIRDREIVVVNRTMKDRKFTITVLESMTNKEGKFLTTSFVVDYWNLETSDLVRSDATSQTWTRVGAYDLPGLTRVITARGKSFAGEPAKEDAFTAKSLTLTNHHLLKVVK